MSLKKTVFENESSASADNVDDNEILIPLTPFPSNATWNILLYELSARRR